MKNIYYSIDLNGNTVQDFAVEVVQELPQTATVGRMVVFGDSLYIYGSMGWVESSAVQIATDWSYPSDETVPSTQLVDSSLRSVNGDIAQVQFDIKGLNEAVNQIDESIGNLDSQVVALQQEVQNKTDITMAVPVWDGETTYMADSTVVYQNGIYISIQDGNLDNSPLDEEWWVAVKGSGGGGGTVVPAVVRTFGDGSSLTYIISHGLNTYNFLYSIRTNDSQRRYVDAEVSAYSLNEVQVTLTTPPAVDGMVITLSNGSSGGGGGGGGGSTTYPVTEAQQVWNISHGAGSMVAVQMFDSNGVEISGAVHQEAPYDSVTITFNEPMAGSAVVIPVAGSGGSGTGQYEQATASNTWTIVHNLGRYVAVQTYDQNGNEIKGEVTQMLPGLNQVRIVFEEEESGVALVI